MVCLSSRTGYYRSSRPSKLDLEIQDINNDYKDKIHGRHVMTKALAVNKEGRQYTILNIERDTDILQAKKDYYKALVSY